MIYDALKNLPRYASLSPDFANAIAWLRDTDLASLPTDGQKIPVAGDHVFAIPQSYDTFTPEQTILESHRKYHDLQVLIAGEEGMRILPSDAQLAVTEPYNPDRDVQFYDPREAGNTRPGIDLTLYPGVFVILGPDDIHGPNRTLGHTPRRNTKVVLKVAVAD